MFRDLPLRVERKRQVEIQPFRLGRSEALRDGVDLGVAADALQVAPAAETGGEAGLRFARFWQVTSRAGIERSSACRQCPPARSERKNCGPDARHTPIHGFFFAPSDRIPPANVTLYFSICVAKSAEVAFGAQTP